MQTYNLINARSVRCNRSEGASQGDKHRCPSPIEVSFNGWNRLRLRDQGGSQRWANLHAGGYEISLIVIGGDRRRGEPKGAATPGCV